MISLKEYILKCNCGARYRFEGEKEKLDKFLDTDTWMCEQGRHVELGKKKNYLSVIGEIDDPGKHPKPEPKQEKEYTTSELQEQFGDSLKHVGFGIFEDPDGNVWDFRSGENGERLYSKVK